MSYRTLLISAVLAAGASLAGLAQADIVAVDSGIAVKESDGVAPPRGMTMSQVASKFGSPVTKVPAVGNPPISRWEYPGFVVYFERDHVIHSVVSEAGAPASEPSAEPAAAPTAPAPAEPAASPPPAAESAPPPAAPAAAPEPAPTESPPVP
jgi:outer membrane protein assembly factor BamE (lipoprotein component of BamABCDE complex)